MFTLLIFLVVLAVLVISHEFGHFIVARKNGIKVHEFGFGFPPRIAGIRRVKKEGKGKWQIVWGSKEDHSNFSSTLYSINLIPLGGFVKIKGEDARGEDANDPDSFTVKKAWQKSAVLVAGVAMNILVAAVLLSIGYTVGIPQAVGDKSTGQVEGNTLQIIQVLPGKPAEVAGLKAGDTITEVNGIRNPGLKQFQEYVNAHRNEDLAITIKRDSESFTKKIRPIIYSDTGKAGLGVGVAEVGLVRYPWYKAIYYGVASTGLYLWEIFLAFVYLLKGVFTGTGVGGAVSGPVGVAVMTGQVARMGIVYLLQFTALLSLNLAVLNILPIPALDGGRLLFVVINKIIGRSLSPKYEQIIHAVSFMLLMLLVIIVTVKDLGAFSGPFINWWKQTF